jgi:hypothetical protein
MRTIIALVLIGLGVGSVDAAAGPRSSPAWVVSLAARVAAGNCDPHPSVARYVRTHRQAGAGGDRVDSDQPVLLVVLRGRFVHHYFYGPPGAKPPRGTAIDFTVDLKTHKILDFGIGSRSPQLSRLGVVHDFLDELHAAPTAPRPAVCKR